LITAPSATLSGVADKRNIAQRNNSKPVSFGIEIGF